MTGSELVYHLQWLQLQHDEHYHKDVVALSLGDRMKHYALHFAKYVAYFIESTDGRDDDRFQRTLVDAFIVSLAAANTLNQNLGESLTVRATGPNTPLLSAGHELLSRSTWTTSDQMTMIKAFALAAGAMAKVCESLDHLDDLPFRRDFRISNQSVFEVILMEAARRDIDLDNEYRRRIEDVEGRSIFRAAYRAVHAEVP